MTVRTWFMALSVALGGCSRGDQQDKSATAAPSATVPRGPDQLVLRVTRGQGEARVYAYPRMDTVVWRASSSPSPERVLAFDDEAGSIAYVDAKGLPARIDFRQGAASTVTKARLTGLSSWDGSNIFGIATDGSVERYGASGLWKWRPKSPARAVFPQPDGSLLVMAQRGDSSVLWRLRPPTLEIVDSVVLPKVNRTLRTQVGDRLYLGSGRELTGVRTRTMEPTSKILFGDVIEALAATPSGDRVFVVVKGATDLEVVNRASETVSGRIDIGRHGTELRVDALGRYLLVRPEDADSAIVVALGTNRVIGAVATKWREDLPFVAPDGGVALAQGGDVVFVDGETLRPRSTVRNGADDFWFPFRWTGFRPRDARLDRPVEFDGPPRDSTAVPTDSPAVVPDSAVPAAPPRDTAARRPTAFTVSFAALLTPDKARELATQIRVGNEAARVVTAMRDGATVYRVVMGPYATREEAERIGRESRQSFWVYEGGP